MHFSKDEGRGLIYLPLETKRGSNTYTTGARLGAGVEGKSQWPISCPCWGKVTYTASFHLVSFSEGGVLSTPYSQSRVCDRPQAQELVSSCQMGCLAVTYPIPALPLLQLSPPCLRPPPSEPHRGVTERTNRAGASTIQHTSAHIKGPVRTQERLPSSWGHWDDSFKEDPLKFLKQLSKACFLRAVH